MRRREFITLLGGDGRMAICGSHDRRGAAAGKGS